jgi:hypothetical protein
MGFGPQLVDFDGDGRDDLLSGTWNHRIILFRRLNDGSFAAGEALRFPDGSDIQIDYGTVVFASDWDDDGDLDVVVGTTLSHIYLVRNEGTREKWSFAKPEKLTADGEEISLLGGDAAPAVVDWDGDGDLDLLSGRDDGAVVWFRNVGTRGEPVLAAAETLIPASERGGGRSSRSKICVVDWNEDGKLDIALGDHGDPFDKEFSADELEWLDESRESQRELLDQWSRCFAEYRALLKAKPDEPAAEQARDDRLAELRTEMQRLDQLRQKQHRDEMGLEAPKQHHGRVWVYLRK